MSEDLRISSGKCVILYAFEVGQAVDLDRASRLVADTVRPQFQRLKGEPESFGYDPPPLSVIRPDERYSLGQFETSPRVELTVWDFGSVSVQYEIVFPPGLKLQDLISMSTLVQQDQIIQMAARSHASSLVQALGTAVINPSVARIEEDYQLFLINDFEERIEISDLVKVHGPLLAQILRQEEDVLSDGLIEEALRYRFSWTRNDVTIVDWSGAVIIGADSYLDPSATQSICSVLEFALVQLLELQHLDEELDNHLNEAYRIFSERRQKVDTTSLYRIGQLTVDSSSLREEILNAINLLGSPTLSQVHALAAGRFGLSGLAGSVERKVGVLDRIYSKMTDQKQNRREVALELVIILLILFEVLQGLWKAYG